jgi:hypothetical protein
MDNEKDIVALKELETVIVRLNSIYEAAQKNVGKSRPILSEQDIAVAKDHLDLVVKYTRLY